VSFKDDVIIEIEIEKRHNEIVEEVVKWLLENDLYKTREIQVEGEGSRVLRSNNRTSRNKRRRKGKRYTELANSIRS